MEWFVFLILTISVAFLFWAITFVIVPLTIGASFEVTKDEKLKKMIQFAKIKMGDKVAELGSGDGKLVIKFAKQGAIVHGYEVNPWLVLLSRWKIRKDGLQDRAFVHWRSFWKVNLGEFDVVSAFQVGYIMNMLEQKLKREARKKIRIVSNNWKFPNLRCLKEEDKVYYYEIKR